MKATSKKPEVRVQIYALSTMPGYLHQSTSVFGNGDITLIDGTIHTPHGIVTVRCQGGQYDHTNLAFVYQNQVYIQRHNRSYSTRYLRTLANAFASEVVAGNTR